MKTGFNDPIAPKGNSKERTSPWNFEQPHYDERSSCYVNAGSHYGVGHRQPVGHKDGAAQKAATLPMDRRTVKTMEVSRVPHRNLDIEMEE